jgi:hypothetical protein
VRYFDPVRPRGRGQIGAGASTWLASRLRLFGFAACFMLAPRHTKALSCTSLVTPCLKSMAA